LKILRRSRRTWPSWARQLMASQSAGSPGPFTVDPGMPAAAISSTVAVVSPAMAPNLSRWFWRFIDVDSSRGHPAHVSSLSGPGTGPGMRPVIRVRPYLEGPVMSTPLSCCLSAAAICFLSRPVPATDSALLPTGRRSFLPDHDGIFHVPRVRVTSGAGRLLCPGAVVLTWLACRRQPALPHPSGRP
jgi:hypothetical protein